MSELFDQQAIHLDEEGGSLFGYVVDAQAPHILNYLAEHTGEELLSQLRQAFLDHKGHVALMRELQVEEKWRGKGIGNSLVAQFVKISKQHGATGFVLVADIGCEQAPGFDLVRWYEKLGVKEAVVMESGYPVMAYPPEFAQKISRTEKYSSARDKP